MSSIAVRTLVKDFLEANSEETVVDLTAQFGELKPWLVSQGVSGDSPWLGLQFVGNNEVPVSLAATNDQGCYRETGIVQFHVATIARIGCGNELLTRGEALGDILRGQRFGGMVIESVTPLNTEAGATLEFDGGWMSGTIIASYYFDKGL